MCHISVSSFSNGFSTTQKYGTVETTCKDTMGGQQWANNPEAFTTEEMWRAALPQDVACWAHTSTCLWNNVHYPTSLPQVGLWLALFLMLIPKELMRAPSPPHPCTYKLVWPLTCSPLRLGFGTSIAIIRLHPGIWKHCTYTIPYGFHTSLTPMFFDLILSQLSYYIHNENHLTKTYVR